MAPPPLAALRTFEVAARHLSFTKAAAELHVTQGAVSQQIKQLEATLGFDLFHRRTRGLALTEKGQALAETAQAVFRRLFDKLDDSRHAGAALAMLRQLELGLFDFRLHAEYDPSTPARVLETERRLKGDSDQPDAALTALVCDLTTSVGKSA